MTETQKRELQAFIDDQNFIGGVTPSVLADESLIWIGTDTYLFKLFVDQTDLSVKYIVDSGAPTLPFDRTCTKVISHHPPLRYDWEDYLGKGMQLKLLFADGSTILSGNIETVTIEGQKGNGDAYSYSLWG